MDILELQQRFAELMSNMFQFGDDGEASLSPDFDPLQKDIAKAMAISGDIAELRDLAQALDMMKDTVSDPEIAKTMAELQTTVLEPQPEIFEAIESCDVELVRAQLRDWNVNETVGKYDSTALYHAMSCMHGTSLEVINLLLDAGANPSKGLTDSNVLHGLGFANLNGVFPEDLARIVGRCIELGADIEQRTNKLQWTPLIMAASEWNPVATEALLLAGADIGARAGEVDGVCYAGEDSIAFAQGHGATMAVLNLYMKPS